MEGWAVIGGEGEMGTGVGVCGEEEEGKAGELGQ